MTRATEFVAGNSLPDITYRTEAPEELVCPRVILHEGVACVYIHKERGASNRGFVPVAQFLVRLARQEPGLAATGYRTNGRQTTISFNKTERVTLSSRLQGYLASQALRPVFDGEAQSYLAGFMETDNPQFIHWLPRYIQTLRSVRQALHRDAPDAIFDVVWKTIDNAVSNSGQGILGFNAADRQREGLVEMIKEIARDGGPTQYDLLVSRLEEWRQKGELPKVPRLLLARAFAAIHPGRYHTTVDAAKQDRIIPWFVEHTGFRAPEGNWAVKAAALTAHLDRCNVFASDQERRNLFPWYVFDQLRDVTGKVSFRPGHTPRPASGEAVIESQRRSIEYRHNVIQDRLVSVLRAEHGHDAVGTEHPTGTGCRADALVLRGNGSLDLYEIKPAATARDAVRQAVGQLLEYGYRRGGLYPASMHVVSDAPLDDVTQEYLRELEVRFGLKFGYMLVASGALTTEAMSDG